MSLLDAIQQHLGPNEINQIAQQIGADPATTQRAVTAALPMILGGLHQTAQQPGGQQVLDQALASHATAADNVHQLLNAAPMGDSGGLLGKILGGAHQPVADGVARTSGLDQHQVGRLLMMLAPLAIGVLARKQQRGELGGNVTDALQREQQSARQAAQQQAPGLGGLFGEIFGAVR